VASCRQEVASDSVAAAEQEEGMGSPAEREEKEATAMAQPAQEPPSVSALVLALQWVSEWGWARERRERKAEYSARVSKGRRLRHKEPAGRP